MASDTRSRNRSGKDSTGRNNNPDGRNQYSGTMSAARHNPIGTAAAVGGVIAAGVFLWSRRNQISDQIGNLTDQIAEWREGVGSDGFAAADDSRRSQVEIAEEALTLKEIGRAE
jgi:hypothetical protein